MTIKIVINYKYGDMNPIPRFGCSQINSLRWRTCLNSLEVLYTQDLLSDDLNHNLDTPNLERWKPQLSLSLKVEDN